MKIEREISNFMRKGAEGALAGMLALGAFGNVQEAKSAEKATNTVVSWVSSKSVLDSDFYIPEQELILGSKNYFYIAVDTTKAVGTNFYYSTWQVYSPVFPTLPNFVTFQTNYFPTSFSDSVWNGFSLDSSLTKIDQTTNSSGLIVNNYATLTPPSPGFHDVSTNFSNPSSVQGGLLAVYEFTLTSDSLAVGTMTNFRLGTVQMKDTAGTTWKTVNPQKNIALANYSDFTVTSAPAVPETGAVPLALAGGAALALRNRRRYYSNISDKLEFDRGKCFGTKN